MSAAESLSAVVRPAAGEPAGALVLLHGRGTDEQDLLPVLDFLDPDRRLVGVAPRGPLSMPPGGRHWYAVPRVGFPDPDTFHSTFEMLGAFLDSLPERLGVAWSSTILGGFSQGTAMSFALSLARGRPSPAGILAMSGFIPTVDGLELDLASRAGLPVWISHGSLDPVIPVALAHDARDRLTAAGLDVSYHETPAQHRIDPRLLADQQAWVRDTIARD